MNDKVALITPSFNRGYIIRETADSIFAQTHENWEWIIVDDGSTDDSWEIIQTFVQSDPRVKAYQRDRGPKGACTCRNMATERSDADWFIFLDTDDLLHPECLKQRLLHTASVEENTVLYFPTLVFEESKDDCMLWDDPDHPIGWIEGVLTMRPPCQGTGTFWPRSLWESHGLWREDLRVWQDIELHARAHWSGVRFEAAQDTFPDFYLRVSPDSLSRVGFHSREKLESRLIVIRECWSRMSTLHYSEGERKAMAAMTLSAIRNATGLGLYSDIETLLSLPEIKLTQQERQLVKLIVRGRRWKLDKLAGFRKQIQYKWTACLPASNRKLASHRWKPETP